MQPLYDILVAAFLVFMLLGRRAKRRYMHTWHQSSLCQEQNIQCHPLHKIQTICVRLQLFLSTIFIRPDLWTNKKSHALFTKSPESRAYAVSAVICNTTREKKETWQNQNNSSILISASAKSAKITFF